jgi:hypothetical protein
MVTLRRYQESLRNAPNLMSLLPPGFVCDRAGVFKLRGAPQCLTLCVQASYPCLCLACTCRFDGECSFHGIYLRQSQVLHHHDRVRVVGDKVGVSPAQLASWLLG